MNILSVVLLAVIVFLSIKVKRNGTTLVTVVQYIRICLKRLQCWMENADDWLSLYEANVEDHRDEVVTPFLGRWMNGQWKLTSASNNSECMAVSAVHLVYNKVGLRSRSVTSQEAIGRQIRTILGDMEMDSESISYWGEMGVQMYFNPPFHVRAAAGKIEGFQ